MDMNLDVNIAGLHMLNPIMIASGVFGFGEEFNKVKDFQNEDLGAMVLKGTTLEERLGNRPPRIVDLGNFDILNTIGLQNPGIRKVLSDYLPRLRQYKTNVILNVAGSTRDEYIRIVEIIGDNKDLKAMEINISCPNVTRGGMEFGVDPQACYELLYEIKRNSCHPVIAKLSPNVTDVKELATASIEAGADALSLINTVRAMSIDIWTKRPRLGNNVGGLSGPAIKPIAIYQVHEAYKVAKKYDTPIIGIGGIVGAEDIVEFFLAGASAVQIGTGILRNKTTIKKIVNDLKNILTEFNCNNISDLTGRVNLYH